MDWATIVTAVVAIYGAVLSTYALLSKRREKQRQVKVSLSMGLMALPSGECPAVVLIEASNPGDRAVTLTNPGILLPNRSTVVWPRPQSHVQFPYDLPEGKRCTAWTEAGGLAQLLTEHGFSGKIKLVGVSKDALGTAYKSRPLRFDMDGSY